MLSERTRSEGTYTLAAGIWSAETVGLACKCYFYIWMWPMLKKKKNEIFNIQKIQVSGFSWKKKKNLKVWHGCIYYCTSTNQPALCKSCPLWRWHVLSNSQPFPWPLRSSKPWGHMTDASLPCIICPCRYLEFVPLGLDESIARSFCLSLGLSDLFVF